ncbi:DUF6541 family protein [Georgenia sp. SYP-B2076]|uniref:DUF6541 family protein n=1 Tax=Georgenia sp. SYP-B2076 TaxID=2495881 RepID=UPI000F8E5ACE|nr:DUF6541 family protein [Georgenia sp. SYP-B2076]
MAFADIAGTVVVAALLTWLPGLLVLSLARLPRLTVLALGPAVTLFLAFAGTLTAHAVGVRWSVLWLALGTAVLMLVVVLLRRWRGLPTTREAAWPPAGAAVVAVLVLVAVGIGAHAYLAASQNFTIIPQDFDSVFQANAVRWIAETGDGTAQGLAGVNNYASTAPFYYPSTLHALMALTFQLTGTGVIAAVHAHILLWMLTLPLGAAALARALGAGPAGAGAAALVSTSFTALPYELIWRGLVPYTQTLVLVPALLATLVLAARRRSVVDTVLLVGAAAALVSTHTSAATTLLVYGLPLVAALLIWARGERGELLRWAGGAVVLLVVLLAPTVAGLLGTYGQDDLTWDWPAMLGVPEGLRTGLLFGTGFKDTVQLQLAVLVWAGVACAVVLRRYRRALALAVGMVAAIGLYVLAVAVDGPLSLALTSFWWNDQLRLSALVAIAAPVFVGILADAVVTAVGRLARRRGRTAPVGPAGPSARPTARPAVRVVAAVAGAAVLAAGYLAVTGGGYSERNRGTMAFRYADGPTVTADEREGMTHLPELVPAGSRVMNDFGDGSALMYALEGVRPVYGHMQFDKNTPEHVLFGIHFDEIATNAEVRQAARALHVDYVWLGEGFLQPGHTRLSGLDTIAEQPDVFELVYSNPGAQLYKINWDALGES